MSTSTSGPSPMQVKLWISPAYKDVPGAGLEFLSVDHIAPPPLADELHLVVGVAVRLRSLPWLRPE